MSMRLMEILAALAKRSALRPLNSLCDRQKQVSTARFEQMLEPIGDDLAGYAFVLRGEFDRLCAENRALKADAERFRSIVSAVVREHPHRRHLNGNAPGHGHSIPGVWDSDNGELAGTECAWCKTWNAAVAATEVPHA